MLRLSRCLLAQPQRWSNEAQAALVALRLPETATLPVIKEKYRKLAMRSHPDRGGSAAVFAELKRNYEVLMQWVGAPEGTHYDESLLQQTLQRAEQVVGAEDREGFRALYDDVLASPWLLGSTKLLYSVVEGAGLMHPLGMDHTQACMAAVKKWEGITKLTPSADIFNAILYPYAFLRKTDVLEDGVMLTKCVTFLAEEMQERSIDVENEWWTKRLIDKALKSSGKFSSPSIIEADQPASWLDARREMERGVPGKHS